MTDTKTPADIPATAITLPPQTTNQALAERTTPATERAVTMATALKGLIPSSIGEAIMLCEALARSTAIPKSLRGNPASLLTVVMTGVEIGLTPLQAVNNIFNIGGNLGMKGNLQLALVRNSGLLVHFDEGFDRSAEDEMDWFGWCDIARKGDVDFRTGEQIIRRKEFSVAMAMAVEVISYENEGEGDTRAGQGRGQRTVQKLGEKTNYKSWPDRMYPMRARTWNLETWFGDVLKGIPSIESLGDGQIIEGELVRDQGDVDDATTLLANIRDEDQDTATAIEAGFDALKYAQARRLQKLTEYKGRPKDLATWLRDEYGRLHGKGEAGTRRRAAEGAKKMDPGSDPQSPATTSAPNPPVDTVAIPVAAVQQMQQAVAVHAAGGDDIDEAMPTTTATPAEDAAMVDRQHVTIEEAQRQERMKDPVVAAAPALSGLGRARGAFKRRF